jgi:peptidoglycan/LPS O-acetylase OafA/YrhL
VPELDGLRTIAIVAVVLFHIAHAATGALKTLGSWGWMGVDLFFVLSGYLITGILLDSRAKPLGEFAGAFYAKRFVRIVPAFAVFMVALLAAPKFLGFAPDEYQVFVAAQPWYWLFATNILFAAATSAWTVSATGPLWSLAVEEHFYLIWPWIVRWLAPRTLFRICVGIIVASPLLRLALLGPFHANPNAIYVLTVTRADGIAFGAAVAMLMRNKEQQALVRRWSLPTIIAGTVLTLSVIAAAGDAEWYTAPMQVVGFSAVGLLAAGIVGYAVTHSIRWLAARPVADFGHRYSYALYLWHMAAVQFVSARVEAHGTRAQIIAAGLGLLPAALSWHFVEAPALRLRRRLLKRLANFALLDQKLQSRRV